MSNLLLLRKLFEPFEPLCANAHEHAEVPLPGGNVDASPIHNRLPEEAGVHAIGQLEAPTLLGKQPLLSQVLIIGYKIEKRH